MSLPVLKERRPWMERAPRPPSHPQMEMVTRDWPPQLRSRRAWSQKWLIRCSRKRSFCPPTFALALRTAPGFPPHPKKVLLLRERYYEEGNASFGQSIGRVLSQL